MLRELLFVILLQIIKSKHVINFKKATIIGGGAAGVFSAIECARQLESKNINYEVTILEASSLLLSKVKISGGGRCNVMHDPNKGYEIIAKGYPRGSKELISPFNSQFGPLDTYKWFSNEGIQLKVESDGRVFPTSDSSATIIDTLLKLSKKLNINIISNANVKNITYNNNTNDDYEFTTHYIKSNKIDSNDIITRRNTLYKESSSDDMDLDSLSTVSSDVVLFATGSSRLGYKIIEGLGHNIIKPLPSLFSFKMKDKSVTELAGVSADKVEIKIIIPSSKHESYKNIKSYIRPPLLPSYTQQGPLLFTHQGMSGPAVLRLSAYGAKLFHELNYKFNITINYLPDYTSIDIFNLLWNEKLSHPNRFVTKGFPSYLLSSDITLISKRLWVHILQRSNVFSDNSIDSKSNENETITWEKLKKIDIEKIANQIVSCKYEVIGRGEYKDEFVTCGGVNLKEINFETLESKLIPGMFFAGEVLDIDGITGGYNFQSAWTTGWIAGHHSAKKLLQ